MHFEQSYYVSVIKRHFPQSFVDAAVLEVGSYDVNGTIREFFENCEYTGLALMPGPGVDVISSGHEYKTYKRFDAAVSCECFEHNPYYLETFENMVSLTCGGGLVIFSCATEGRPEHGTSRTSPHDSPGTVSTGWEYYQNLTEEDFSSFDFQKNFAGYRFMVNPGSQDLYFVGVKYPAPQDLDDRLNRIVAEAGVLVDGSVKISAYEKLQQSGFAAEAEEFLDGFVSTMPPAIEAYALYKRTWHLISSKRYQDAERTIGRIFALSQSGGVGDRAEYHFQHSQFLHETGKYEKAVAAVRTAISRAPFYADYWEHLAKLLLNAGDIQGAENAVSEAGRLSSLNASLQKRLNEIHVLKGRAAGDAKLSTYDISFASLSNAEFDQAIRMWNLESPIAGTLEAAADGELNVSGWVLTREERDEVSLLVRVGTAVEEHKLNVQRPDVVAAILQKSPDAATPTQCGFRVVLPMLAAKFRVGFRVVSEDYWAREVRVEYRPQQLRGKDSWEFAGEPGNGILDLPNEAPPYLGNCVLEWEKKIADARINTDVSCSVLVVPHKAAVYPDRLPPEANLRFQRPVYRILAQRPDVIYPLERMISSSFRRPTYSRSGALWSPYGAYVAYRALLDRMGSAGLKKKEVDESRVVWGAENAEPAFERKAVLSVQNGLIGPGQIRLYQNADGSLPKVALFCGAFGMAHFDAFLAESCSELLCIQTPYLDAEVVKRFTPDFVAFQYAEAELANSPGAVSSVYQVIKSGIDNGVYSATMLEQFVSSANSFVGILSNKVVAELTLEAQKALS